MYTLFADAPKIDPGKRLLPRHEYLRRRFRDNFITLRHYYRRSAGTVPSHHPLVKVLQSMPLNPSYDDLRYYDFIADRMIMYGTVLKLNSPALKVGALDKSYFYGPETTEILLATAPGLPRGLDLKKNWRELSPLRVLTHPHSDLNMDIRDGRGKWQRGGYAVIEIDVPLLCIQYRYWVEDVWKKQANGEKQTTGMFIYNYPLANMIPSDTDVAFINQLRNMNMGIENEIPRKRSPVALPTTETALYQTEAEMLDNVVNRTLPLYGQAMNIFTLFQPSMFETMQLPHMLMNYQNIGILVIARMPYMELLLSVNYQEQNTSNQTYLNQIKRELDRIKGGRYLQSIPGVDGGAVWRRIEENIIPLL